MNEYEGPTDAGSVHRTSAPAGVTAVVLTYKRPRLASQVTRSLLDVEGLSGERVVVVVNGEGGLDDPELEASVRMERLPRNTGPAGGFRAGLEAAFADPSTEWVYLCEDDIGLFELPTPRLGDLVDRVEQLDPGRSEIGAVVAYGRNFVGRGAHTVNVVPTGDLEPVDVACWGATLISRRTVEAGVLPDPSLFFGVEDFDFFCRVRKAGLSVLVDGPAARSVADQQTTVGRDQAISAARPGDDDESWRAYYHARNSFELARRYGTARWYLWHLVYSARHLQLASTGEERKAIVRGLWDGARGRLGENPRYRRQVGEFGTTTGPTD